MGLSWEERAERVRGGETELVTASVDRDGVSDRAMFEVIFQRTSDGVVLCHSVTGEYFEANDRFCELTGYSRAELLGQSSVTLGLAEPGDVRVRDEKELTSGLDAVYEQPLTRNDGARRWIEFSHHEVGPGRRLVIMRDITDAKDLEESLRDLASTDMLTQVLNSPNFRKLAELALVQWPDALMVVVGVDSLTLINDTWGHAVGDEALVAVASALQSAVGQGGLVGRLGGDQFAALLTGAGEDPAFTLRRVRSALMGIRLKAVDAIVSASIGVASGQRAYEELEQAAEAAMYDGKGYRSYGRDPGR